MQCRAASRVALLVGICLMHATFSYHITCAVTCTFLEAQAKVDIDVWHATVRWCVDLILDRDSSLSVRICVLVGAFICGGKHLRQCWSINLIQVYNQVPQAVLIHQPQRMAY